jgi:hypothetical protein
LAEAKYFSTVDSKSGYWQVDLHPDDKEKMVFSMKHGLWQFTGMPFGLCNAPATFERLIETALRGLTYWSCPAYPDDVILVGLCTYYRWFISSFIDTAKPLTKHKELNQAL